MVYVFDPDKGPAAGADADGATPTPRTSESRFPTASVQASVPSRNSGFPESADSAQSSKTLICSTFSESAKDKNRCVGPSAIESDASRYAWYESRNVGRRILPTLSRKAGGEGESLAALKSSMSAWSAPSSSSNRLGKRSSNTRFRKACAFSALCQMKRARPVLIYRGAIAGIHAAMLTRRERSQKKKRLSSWAVSNRIQRALGCGLNKNVDACAMSPVQYPSALSGPWLDV